MRVENTKDCLRKCRYSKMGNDIFYEFINNNH